MNQVIHNELTRLAQNGLITSYGDLGRLIGLSMEVDNDRDEMTRILEVIARNEQLLRHPMLTAIVVHHGDDHIPGEGFFAIASEFGRFNGSRNPMDRLQYWVTELQSVFAHW